MVRQLPMKIGGSEVSHQEAGGVSLSPRELLLLPARWLRMLIAPNAANDSAVMPTANWPTLVASVVLWALLSSVIFWLLWVSQFGFSFFSYGIGQLLRGFGRTLLQFALGLGITYALATYLFRGKGSLLQLGYLIALYAPPLSIGFLVLEVLALRFNSGFLLGLISLLYWLAVVFYLAAAQQAVFDFSRQTALLVAATTVSVPLLGAIGLMFNWYGIPGFIMGFDY